MIALTTEAVPTRMANRLAIRRLGLMSVRSVPRRRSSDSGNVYRRSSPASGLAAGFKSPRGSAGPLLLDPTGSECSVRGGEGPEISLDTDETVIMQFRDGDPLTDGVIRTYDPPSLSATEP